MGRDETLEEGKFAVELSVQTKDIRAFRVKKTALLRLHMFIVERLGVSGRLKTIHLSLGNFSRLYNIYTGLNIESQVCTS